MTTPPTQIQVYLMKPGEQYEDLRRYCPIDRYELTIHSLTEPNGIVVLTVCPIDAIRATILLQLIPLATPIFTLFGIHTDIKKQVDETIAALKFILTQWINSNPDIPPEQATYVLVNVLDKILYDQSKVMGLTKELAVMPPQPPPV